MQDTTQTNKKGLDVSSFGQFIFSKNHLRQLPKALEKKAELELNEMPASREAEIDEFRKMVLKEQGLKANTNDAFLLRFLRARKFDKSRALQLMKNHYKLQTTKFVTSRRLLPSNDRRTLEKELIRLLPHKDAQGRAVLFWMAEKWDIKEVDLMMQMRTALLNVEKVIQDETLQICGFVLVLDFNGISFDRIRQFTPYLAYLCISFVQIFLHGNDLTSFHEHLSPDGLPEELGGTQGPLNNKEWCEIILNSELEYLDDLNFGYNKPSGN